VFGHYTKKHWRTSYYQSSKLFPRLITVLLQKRLDHTDSSVTVVTTKPRQVEMSAQATAKSSIYIHGMVVQVVIQLIQHDSIVVFLNWFSLRTNAVVFFQEIAAKTAEPGYLISIKAMRRVSSNTYIAMSPSSYSE
jgi:hypothetical protein